eukprot:m.78593 g.78593  ORF g.78593 m.78593 type:complete len:56 (+) comp25130_c0_seq1:112-279(+)
MRGVGNTCSCSLIETLRDCDGHRPRPNSHPFATSKCGMAQTKSNLGKFWGALAHV